MDVQAATETCRESARAVEELLSRGRLDLIPDVYTARGDWNGAVAAAREHAPYRLSTVYYSLGKKEESERCYSAATRAYESAGTHRSEVPRMLLNANRLTDLESYIRETGFYPSALEPSSREGIDDRDLWVWWGRYCASQGQREAAFEAFAAVEDTLSTTKLHWAQGDRVAAVQLARETKDKASLFYLGRQFEALGQIPDAVESFSLAGYPEHGVRLAMANGLDAALFELTHDASMDTLLEIALHYEAKGQWTQAARLFAKAGRLAKAVAVCAQSGSIAAFEALLAEAAFQQPTGNDTDLRQRVAEAFLEFGEYRRAMVAFGEMGQIERALDIAERHEIALDETLADQLTTRSAPTGEERARCLRLVAKACKRQGAFLLAAKKFSEAGDRIKAVKALIRAGDAEKVIAFASNRHNYGVPGEPCFSARSRSADVYIVAANFLRTLDWAGSEEWTDKIIAFYTKAKATQQLITFHETRAQIEIDEYRDYERGLACLREAQNLLESVDIDERDEMLADLEERLGPIERFLEARNQLHTNAEAAFALCHRLLTDLVTEEMDKARLRRGDIYSLLIEFSHLQGDLSRCCEMVEAMKRDGLSAELYIDAAILRDLDL